VNEKVKAGVARGVADVNMNTELAPNVSMCSGCLADTSGDCGDVDYSTDFVHQIKDPRGHVDGV
jgi:hypothetical protein